MTLPNKQYFINGSELQCKKFNSIKEIHFCLSCEIAVYELWGCRNKIEIVLFQSELALNGVIYIRLC